MSEWTERNQHDSEIFNVGYDDGYDNGYDDGFQDGYKKAVNESESLKVVRCKDCKYWTEYPDIKTTEQIKVCSVAYYMVDKNGFCCYGEMRK